MEELLLINAQFYFILFIYFFYNLLIKSWGNVLLKKLGKMEKCI